MAIQITNIEQLDRQDWNTWSSLRGVRKEWQSALFSPDFALEVARVCGPVEVAIHRHDGKATGFFPFQRKSNRVGTPIAHRINEVHGPVGALDLKWDAEALLMRACLASWHFDGMPVVPGSFESFIITRAHAPFIDIEDGFESYAEARRRAGSNQIAQSLRKERKLRRDCGEIRFELECFDDHAFSSLLSWKSQQYARTGEFDLFCLDWTQKLLQHLLEVRTPGCSGLMSCLYVNRKPVAIHFGVRSESVLTWWFPAYDRQFAKYSVGTILLTKILQTGSDLGIQRVDLGRGEERYKQSFATSAFDVAEGVVTQGKLRYAMARWYARSRDRANGSRLGRAALRLGRQVKQKLF